MTSSSPRLPAGQDWYIPEIKDLGFYHDPDGMCHGLCMEAVIYLLLRKMPEMQRLLIRLKELSPIREKYNPLIKKLSSFKAEIQSEVKKQNSNPAVDALEKLKQEKLSLLSVEERDIWEIAKLLYGISIFQLNRQTLKEEKLSIEQEETWSTFNFFNPHSCHPNDLKQKNMWELLTPNDLNQKGGVVCIPAFTGCYTPKELYVLQKMLHETALTENTDPILCTQSHGSHVVMEGIDPLNNSLTFIDANQLPGEIVASDEDMAYRIAQGVFKNHKHTHTALFSRFYVTRNNQEIVTKKIAKLLDAPEIKAMHVVTREKAQFIGADGSAWLYLAARHGDVEKIEKLMNYGACVNRISHPNGWTPFTLAIYYNQEAAARAILGGPVKINQPRPSGQTALSDAVRSGKESFVKMVLSAYPIVDLNDDKQNLIALAKDHPNITALLQKINPRMDWSPLESTKVSSLLNVLTKIRDYLNPKELVIYSRLDKQWHAFYNDTPRLKYLRQSNSFFAERYYAIRSLTSNRLAELKSESDAKNQYLRNTKESHLLALASQLLKEEKLSFQIFELFNHFIGAMELFPEMNPEKLLIIIFAKKDNHLILSFLEKFSHNPSIHQTLCHSALFRAITAANAPLVFALIPKLKTNASEINRRIFSRALQHALESYGHHYAPVLNLPIIQELIKAGASLLDLVKRNVPILEIPIRTDKTDVMEFLLAQNIPEIIEQKFWNNLTPLGMVICSYELSETTAYQMVRLLLKYGAKREIFHLDKAIERHKIEMFRLLLQENSDDKLDLNDCASEDIPIFLLAPSVEHSQLLLDAGANLHQQHPTSNYNALMLAVYHDVILVEFLLKKGLDPHVTRFDGFTTLMSAVHDNNFAAMKLLIEHKLDVNAKTTEGNTAFLEAVNNNSLEMMQTLLDAGATDLCGDQRQTTPWIVHAANKDNALKFLLEQKLDVNATDKAGNTALITLLTGLAMDNIFINNRIVNNIDLLFEYKPDVLVKNKKGNTALTYALSYYNSKRFHTLNVFNTDNLNTKNITEEIILKLIKAGADPNDTSLEGKTALHLIIEHNADKTESNDLLDTLLKHNKINPEARDQEGNTPLHSAIIFFQTPLFVELLLAAGANPFTRNDKGETPLELLAKINHKNLNPTYLARVKELLEKAAQKTKDLVLEQNRLFTPANSGAPTTLLHFTHVVSQ